MRARQARLDKLCNRDTFSLLFYWVFRNSLEIAALYNFFGFQVFFDSFYNFFRVLYLDQSRAFGICCLRNITHILLRQLGHFYRTV